MTADIYNIIMCFFHYEWGYVNLQSVTPIVTCILSWVQVHIYCHQYLYYCQILTEINNCSFEGIVILLSIKCDQCEVLFYTKPVNVFHQHYFPIVLSLQSLTTTFTFIINKGFNSLNNTFETSLSHFQMRMDEKV